jgi:7-cyano-7-deazaguanine synthase in queuosine biosynthesis
MSLMRILWSGGFDSTYLVLRALQAGQRVEPVYAWQEIDWQKQINEQEAIARVRHALPAELRRELLEIHREPLSDHWSTYEEIEVELWAAVPKGDGLSPQDAFLASVARRIGPIEMAVVADDPTQPGVMEILRREGVRFPLVAQSKAQILSRAVELGIEPYLRLTWSCEASVSFLGGKPCGVCEPCRHRIIPAEAFGIRGSGK